MTTQPSKNRTARKRVVYRTPVSVDPAVIHHPDGWYWLADDGRQEIGPFDTADAALADFRASVPSEIAPGESLQEAESDLGIAEWIDPDTGQPAEDHIPRTEEH